MRALICSELGPADRLSVGEMPDPVAGPGEVVIDVRAAGLNFPDTLVIEGKYQFQPELPFVPGGEAAGIVAQAGSGVDLEPGTPVMAVGLSGAFADKWSVPAAMTVPVPDSMDLLTAAGFGMTYGTAYYALHHRGRLQPGETLLVLGAAGGVGSAAVQVGKAIGARVIAAASTDDKLAFAAGLGADEGINYTTDDLRSRVKELTGGSGVDVVFDPVGGEMTETALRSTAFDGRLLIIGFASGTIPKVATNLALLKGASIVGVFWGSWAMRDTEASRRAFAELFAMVDDGRIRPAVTDVYPLEEFLEAFSALTSRRAKGKTVLTMS